MLTADASAECPARSDNPVCSPLFSDRFQRGQVLGSGREPAPDEGVPRQDFLNQDAGSWRKLRWLHATTRAPGTKKAGGVASGLLFDLCYGLCGCRGSLVASAAVTTIAAVTATAATTAVAATASAAATTATVTATGTAAAATAAGFATVAAAATATTATTVATTTTTTATSVGALFTRTGLVDSQGASVDVFAVQGFDRGIGFAHIRHGDEGKTLRPASEFVHDDAGLINRAISSELGCQRGLGCFVSEVSNVYFHFL